jgi:hypothetical protein
VSNVAESNCGHLSGSRSGRSLIGLCLSLGGLGSGLGSGRGSLGGGGGSAVGGGLGRGVVLLAGRVNRDLNGDLTALNFLAVHLVAGLLLELLGAEGHEAEATALAGLTASLELLDHEAGDGAEGDLGLGGGVVLEDLEELQIISTQSRNISSCRTYPVLLEVVRQVGDHDLGLGRDTILRGTALLALAGGSGLLGGRVLVGKRFVRGLCQGSNLAGYICGGALGGGSVGELDLLSLGAFSL